ncbi:WcaI family glycosyltransferase [Cesiribacter sp. SM1]|uniref:WcaI family glycosyltransferase n=1 Tax=Cesiribacter sp. SM1 TaxID=2861196 RepID=UPI001CD728F4|nr:WcaI family glycosyltransferase [Cesiribacter sp. SM1]
MKKILLIGYNYSPEPTGIGKYSGEMVLWLARQGYECTVITAYPYYPYWKVQEPYHGGRFWYKKETQHFESGGKIRVYRCPMYVPDKPSGLKRMLLDLTFSITAFFKLLQLLPERKFDFVVTVVPSFQFGLLGIFYKKLRSSRLLYHIQDMQIEAARDLQMIKSEGLINTLFKVEKYIFSQCDSITCVGEGMVRRTQAKTDKTIAHFPNWVDTSFFYPLNNRSSLKVALGYQPDEKLILYSGAIGEKQGLGLLLQAAKALEEKQNWKFLICGSGPYKEKLQRDASDLKLNNLVFCPLQPTETFNMFLNAADLHLVIQRADAYDLVMPSKLTTILAVGGLALVTANKDTGLNSMITRHKIGIAVEAENTQALINGICKALEEDHEQTRKNARFFAEVFLSIDGIMGSFESTHILQEASQKTTPQPALDLLPLPSYQQDRSAWKTYKGAVTDSSLDTSSTKVF